jgi:hypothetical protein
MKLKRLEHKAQRNFFVDCRKVLCYFRLPTSSLESVIRNTFERGIQLVDSHVKEMNTESIVK